MDEQIIERIFEKIGIESQKNEIQRIIRLKENKENPVNTMKIIPNNEETKDAILQAAKQYYKTKGILSSSEVGLGGKLVIYIKVELTTRNKYILWKSRELKKFGYKFVWFKNGKIFVRKN